LLGAPAIHSRPTALGKGAQRKFDSDKINDVKTSPMVSLMAALTLSLGGCFAPDLSEADDVGSASQADETENSLTANSLTANSLTANSLTANSLTANSLTANSLTANSLTANALTDPRSRDVLKYIVGCALPAGAHLDITVAGTVYGYDGQLGLATSWGGPGGHCDSNCVGAVSSCVLARLNYLGVQVPISVRGAGLHTTPAELAAYPHIDGVYYGNIFTSPQLRYACLPPGVTELTRVCGPSLSGCVVNAVGPCEEVCDGVKGDGSYPSCRDALSHGTKYKNSITVFLQ
jgi:hypothetical protein